MISNIILLGFGNINTVPTLGFGGGVSAAAPIFVWTGVDAQSTSWADVGGRSGTWTEVTAKATNWS